MLFSCSIRDNISYGAVDPDAVSTEDIYRAARMANAYNFIQAFPKGFDTVVGEKGVLLSGETLRSHLIYPSARTGFYLPLLFLLEKFFIWGGLLYSCSDYSLKKKAQLFPNFLLVFHFPGGQKQRVAIARALLKVNTTHPVLNRLVELGYRLLAFTFSCGEILFSCAVSPQNPRILLLDEATRWLRNSFRIQ